MDRQSNKTTRSYECQQCGASFPKLRLLAQHRRLFGHFDSFECSVCGKRFGRRSNLDNHLLRHKDSSQHECQTCGKVFSRADLLQLHAKEKHIQSGSGAIKRSTDYTANNPNPKKRKLATSDDPEEFYNIHTVKETNIEKFKTKATYYKITLHDLEVLNMEDIFKTLKKLFTSIIENITRSIASSDLVRVSIDNPELDFPITLPFMKRSALTVDRILSEIERVLQSYEQFVLDETLGIEVVHVHLPIGGVSKRSPFVNLEKLLSDKKSIIRIQNTDDLCCARALVTARARVEKCPQWNNIRQGRSFQKYLAVELHHQAGIPLKRCGIEEVKKFQLVMPKYQIHVISKEHFNAIIYAGPEGGIPIYVYYHDNHYDVITKMTGFLNKSYFCHTCKKGYAQTENHACNNPCIYCRHVHDADSVDEWVFCQDCNRYLQNQACFELHRKKSKSEKSTCEQYFRCKKCDQIINMRLHKRSHECGEQFCKTCKDFFENDHQCYMLPTEQETVTKQQSKDKMKYIYFDFECTQDSLLQCTDGYNPNNENKCTNCRKSWCGSFEHTPNLCVAHRVCVTCQQRAITPDSICENCGRNEMVFTGTHTTKAFCQWLFSAENYGATVLCHNFKGYDSYPILKYLHENAILPKVITTGSKYMSIEVPVCKIRLIDSLNFIPMPLADMPKAFGETELAKGYFPHLFNRQENQSAILSHLPDVNYYNPDGMKPKARQVFLSWYSEHKDDPFDFQKELLRYCKSDVDILRRCCQQFRTLFMEITQKDGNQGIDPFVSCITIASACSLVFRSNFLQHNSIGIIPPHGYRPEEKQSLMGYQWLAYLANTENVYIQHSRNKGEKHIGPYKLDGYYETEKGEKTAFEFHGCFWHGCPHCYSRQTLNPVCNMSMSELHMRTLEKKKYLELNGFKYVEKWECEFKRELEKSSEMRQYVNSLELVSPLEPRDAFFGGRTEGFQLYETASPTKEIKYYDVTSLYPYVNKTGKIPLGHPEIITDSFGPIDKYEGLVKCKIIPPRGLYMPVLPIKCNGKLMFSLCRTCSETQQQEVCNHTDDDRAFIGTWVTDEVKKAIEKGYRLCSMYEVWNFTDISQYDPETKSGGVFTEYVNTFLKVKQEASGWPAWCRSEQDKKQYISDYLEREGILLNCNNIKKNPGLRSLAKLMLNSFWGKFGQRSNLAQTTYISDPNEYFDMMTSDEQSIKNVRFISDEAVQLDWVYSDDFISASCRTNVVIAAYTTAQARLTLYNYLEKLDRRALYCDTDSIVFTTSPGQWEPTLGDYLGDLTNEISENSITKFVTGGPKNYAYLLEKPNADGLLSCCKIRGITLNFKNLIDINFETIENLVTGQCKSSAVTVVDQCKIRRNPSTGNIITTTEKKDYKIVFDKRVIKEGLKTNPYGM